MEKLRFKDDLGNVYPNVKIETLGKISKITKGKQLSKIDMISEGHFYVLNGGIEPSGYTDKWNTPQNTITISEGGNSCGYVNFNKENFWSGGHNYSLLNPKVNINFLYSFLKYKQNEIMKLRVGSGLPNIQIGSLAKFEIKVPCGIEQEKIGGFLSSFDKLIQKQQGRIGLLKELKKGYLQQLFPVKGSNIPNIRFNGFTDAWEQRKFGDCVLIQRGGSPRPIQCYLTDQEDGINWIKIGDVSNDSRYITSTQEKIIPEGAKNSRFVYKGDLILSNSMSFGRPYIMAIDGCIHDGWLLIRDEKNMFNLEYLLELLSSDKMLEQYKSLAAGGVVNNLNSQLVQSVNITYPQLNEQALIGYFFVQLDNLITLHQRKLEGLEEMKKGYMQRLFA